MQIADTAISTIESWYAPGSNCSARSSTTSVTVWVCPLTSPDTTRTAPNSPRDRATLSTTPYARAHLTVGKVTRRNRCRALAPSERAA